MEKELNIAAILMDKLKGIKLWSPAVGKCCLHRINDYHEWVYIETGGVMDYWFDKKGLLFGKGERLLFPSKQMRDWSKFAWKKGDVLVMDGCRVVFDKWLNDDYTKFNAVHLITSSGVYFNKPSQNSYSPISHFITKYWRKMTDAETKIYMDSLERECGGKLNLSTLQIEQPKQEFKDGDIVFMREVKSEFSSNCIFILRGEYNGEEKALYHVFYNADNKFVYAEYGSTRVHYNLRPATDSEKQQLFDALAKKGKTWDAEKKAIVDLPKKCEFKAMDWCLMRDKKGTWKLCQFSFFDDGEGDMEIVIVTGNNRLGSIPHVKKSPIYDQFEITKY